MTQMDANGREWTQITVFVIPNTPLCHSEHREESRPGKGKRFFAHALNDKCPNANFANDANQRK